MSTANQSIAFETELGQFTIGLLADKAPVTCHYFSEIARLGGFDGTSIFRIVAEDNGSHRASFPIEVVQGGLRDTDAQPVAPIAHEGTDVTGILHQQWTVSTARFEPGQTYGSFFICMRDEPALDFGGARHTDGLGFAAFGRIAKGKNNVSAIFAKREREEVLASPIRILRASLLK